MKRDVKKAWVAELRSGKHPQTKGYLNYLKDGELVPFGKCCLGVLCEVVGVPHKAVGHAVLYDFSTSANEAAMPPAGFQGLSFRIMSKLAVLNDGDANVARKTFPEIADWIVKNVPVDKED